VSNITPGGWFVYEKSGYTRLFVGSDSHDICEMNHAGGEGTERANAALIAAAPHLWLALVACRNQLATWVNTQVVDDERDHAAIKLADHVLTTLRREMAQ